MSKATGFVREIFTGIQGEGSCLGQRQIFLRLAGCREKCAYCDTPESRQPNPRRARLVFPGSEKSFRWLANPLTVIEIAGDVGEILHGFGPFSSLAITGGEPLEQADFVQTCLHEFKTRHWRLPAMLETNGLQVEGLKKVISSIAFIAADLKLHSATGLATPWARHVQFLKSARRVAGCVKVVVVPDTTSVEIVHAARLAQECVPGWDFILQPATGVNWKNMAARRRLENFMQTAARLHSRVRLIPQIHPILGLA